MPTDPPDETVQIKAPFADVLATVRDVESQVEWIPEILEVELLEVYEDRRLAGDRPVQGVRDRRHGQLHVVLRTPRRWHELDDGGGKVADRTGRPLHARRVGTREDVGDLDLTIHHNLPLPGFIRNRVIKGLVDSTLTGLKKHLET